MLPMPLESSEREVLRAIVITGCYWGDTKAELWVKSVERIANSRRTGYVRLL